jgi:cysteine desulfurase
MRGMHEEFGNAHSADHIMGANAARLVATAAKQVGNLVGAEVDDVHFVGSATEALRLVVGFEMEIAQSPFTVAASRIEHPASISLLEAAERAGYLTVNWIECDDQGLVAINLLVRALDRRPTLLWLMAANNEVGALQPIQKAAEMAHSAGTAIVVDASQAAGRVAVESAGWGIDYLVLSAHKLYGPKGVGALVGPGVGRARSPFPLEAHEATPNTPAIAGFGEACRLRRLEMAVDEPRIQGLRDRLLNALRAAIPDLVVNGPAVERLAGNLHISVPGAPNDQVVAQLRETVAISTGAACTSGVDAPSHVLRAMGLPAWRQETALRIGVGKFNTEAEIDFAASEIAAAAKRVRAGR